MHGQMSKKHTRKDIYMTQFEQLQFEKFWVEVFNDPDLLEKAKAYLDAGGHAYDFFIEQMVFNNPRFSEDTKSGTEKHDSNNR